MKGLCLRVYMGGNIKTILYKSLGQERASECEFRRTFNET